MFSFCLFLSGFLNECSILDIWMFDLWAIYMEKFLLQLLDLVHRVSLEVHCSRAQTRIHINNYIPSGKRFVCSSHFGKHKIFCLELPDFLKRIHLNSNIIIWKATAMTLGPIAVGQGLTVLN